MSAQKDVDSEAVDDLEAARQIDEECIRCGSCVRHCGFLQNFTTPGDIAQQTLADPRTHLRTAYYCSLCSLCTAVCPKDLPIASMFLGLRRYAVNRSGSTGFPEHNRLFAYERIGISSLLRTTILPQGCDTIFFPGCSLPGIRPDLTLQIYLRLCKTIPRLGLVLDCCSKPSHDLGMHSQFEKRFLPKLARLRKEKISHIIVGCPSCYRIFEQYGAGLSVSLVYSELDRIESNQGTGKKPDTRIGKCTIHDPCTLRFSPDCLESARNIARRRGADPIEMKHSRRKTFCCGEGAGAGLLKDAPTADWKAKRLEEACENTIFTLCGGCATTLSSTHTYHLLDLYDEQHQWSEESDRSVRFFPLTYLNRLALRLRLLFLRFSLR